MMNVTTILFRIRSTYILPTPWGGSPPIFVRGCAISGFDTPPFDKARQRRKFDPFVRQIWEKVGKNDLPPPGFLLCQF